MHLKDLKRQYDVAISLGQNCGPAYHLGRHKLRYFSSPLDWVISRSVADVVRLLENQFHGFLELPNLRRIGSSAHIVVGNENDEVPPNHVETHMVEDANYNIISVHDFSKDTNEDWSHDYPAVKEKFNRRITRFYEKLATCDSFLFIRLNATRDEAAQLESVLSKLTNNKAHLLVVNLGSQSDIVVQDWGLERVCSVEIPDLNGEDGVYSAWDTVLSEITICKK